MRILHVIPTLSPRYGGPAKACLEMGQILADRGHSVEIFTTNYDGFGHYTGGREETAYEPMNGVRIRTFPVDLPPAYFRASRPLARALRTEMAAFDLVHIHSLYLFTTLAAGHYAHRNGVPFILRPHGSLDPYIYRRRRGRKAIVEVLCQNRLFRRAAAVHYTAVEEQRLAEPYSFDAPAIVLPLGLHPDSYSLRPSLGTFRERHPETKGKRLLLFLGRINFKKGLDLVVEAFARVFSQRKDVHLVIAGPDNEGYQPQVETWLRQAGVLGCTTFTGMLTGATKLAALNDADLFLLPSYAENFGISVVEAMACGLPVLISDKVNIWREVQEGGAGEVEPCDADRFAERALAMLAEDQQQSVYGRRGIATVQDTFNWSKIAPRLEAAYQSVVENR